MVGQLVKDNVVAGISWGTIQNTKQMCCYEGNLGYEFPYIEQKLSKKHFYDIASLTKVIGTTTRLLQLIDEKKLTFQTQVKEILPEYFFLTSTMEDLLMHSSGLPADLSNKTQVTKKMIKEFLLENRHTTSRKVLYSDLGFFILGEVICQVDQCSLDESFNRYIFKPMGMTNTSYHIEEKQNAVPTEITKARGTIQGMVHDSKAFQLPMDVGSAGLFSTLEDLIQFSSCFLTNTLVTGKELFSDTLVEKIQTTNNAGRTYGWEVKENQYQESYLYHTGFTGTSIGLNIAKKEALILLTNRIHPSREERGFMKAREAVYYLYF